MIKKMPKYQSALLFILLQIFWTDLFSQQVIQVKKTDKWETSYSVVGSGVSGMIFNSYTLDNVTENNAQLSVSSELESVPSTDNPNMSIDVKGKSTGNITIDKKTALIITSQDKKHYEGTMTVKNQGNEMKMPMVIDAQSDMIRLK